MSNQASRQSPEVEGAGSAALAPAGGAATWRLLPWPQVMLLGFVAVCLVVTAVMHILRHWHEGWAVAAVAVLAVGIGVSTGPMCIRRQREAILARRHLEAMASLHQICAAISARMGAGNEILQQLAEAARQLLAMDRAGITLIDRRRQSLRIAAYAGDRPAGSRDEFKLGETPASRRVFESNDALFVEDAAEFGGDMNQDIVREFSAGSIMLLPLRLEGRIEGMMALSTTRPRRFTDGDRRLARLLGAEATVILANNELYEQTRSSLEMQKKLSQEARRDADVRATLLRELNHRVKNSLAGIVGLLSYNVPELPPPARAWLDRAIERIGNMARAHELFSAGSHQISLARLIEGVVPSLSVVKPAGVTIRTELGTADMLLDTQRAVSLAMVLHELCVNAIVHGSGDEGEIVIRTRTASEDRVVLEVIDQGRGSVKADRAIAAGSGASPVPATMQGTGLSLVGELVGREMGGVFHLDRRQDGGTIATVEVPRAKPGDTGAATGPEGVLS